MASYINSIDKDLDVSLMAPVSWAARVKWQTGVQYVDSRQTMAQSKRQKGPDTKPVPHDSTGVMSTSQVRKPKDIMNSNQEKETSAKSEQQSNIFKEFEKKADDLHANFQRQLQSSQMQMGELFLKLKKETENSLGVLQQMTEKTSTELATFQRSMQQQVTQLATIIETLHQKLSPVIDKLNNKENIESSDFFNSVQSSGNILITPSRGSSSARGRGGRRMSVLARSPTTHV